MSRRKEKWIAFEKIVDSVGGSLIGYASRLTSNKSAAEDIVQNTFLKFLKSWKEPMELTPKMTGWLFRVAHNESVDYMRRESRIRRINLEHGEDCISCGSHSPPPEETLDMVEKALEVLTDKERELVILKIYEEKSYREISRITGYSTGNVGVTLHHAMKKLAAELQGKEGTAHDG